MLSLRAYAKHRKARVYLAGLFRPSKKLLRAGSSPKTAGSSRPGPTGIG
jgi:hypothetical protein